VLIRLAIAVAAGALVAGLASPGASGAPRSAAVAVVVHTDDRDLIVGAGEIEDAYDVRDRDYTLRSNDGHEEPPLHVNAAASVRRVLDLAGVNPDAIGFVETRRGDGTYATLDRDDVSSSPPFVDGPPIVFIDGPSVRYLRPVRGSTDSNASDNLATLSDEPLELTVHAGNLLIVDATASDLEVDQGESVSFAATTSGAEDGEEVSVDWDFDDGESAQGQTVTHTFTHEGTYAVIARAEGDRDSAGTSALLRVVVGTPPPAKGGGPGGGTGGDDDLPDGPKHGDGHGGNGNGDGSADGDRDGGARGVGSGDGDDEGDPPPPGVTPAPVVAIPPAPSPGAAPGGETPDGEESERAVGNTAGDTVAGRILSVAAPIDAGPPESADPAVSRPPEEDAWRGAGLAAGTLLLALAGAGFQARSFRMRP